MPQIPFQALSIDHNHIRQKYHESLQRVLEHGQFIRGPESKLLSTVLTNFLSVPYTHLCSSGTAALVTSLIALRLPSRSFIAVPSLTWIGTANAVLAAGHIPYFCDVDDYFCITVDSLHKAFEYGVSCVIYVSFTGVLSPRALTIKEICNQHGIALVEDAAQSFGSYVIDSFDKKRLSGSIGDISAISINPMKVFCSLTEAGAVFTSNSSYHARILRYINQGFDKSRLNQPEDGQNYRLSTLAAAFALDSFDDLPARIARRRFIAQFYDNALSGFCKTPYSYERSYHTYYTYTILTPHRDGLRDYLHSCQIQTQLNHLPLLNCFKKFASYPSSVTQSNQSLIDSQLICFPCNNSMSDDDIRYVCESVAKFFSTV